MRTTPTAHAVQAGRAQARCGARGAARARAFPCATAGDSLPAPAHRDRGSQMVHDLRGGIHRHRRGGGDRPCPRPKLGLEGIDAVADKDRVAAISAVKSVRRSCSSYECDACTARMGRRSRSDSETDAGAGRSPAGGEGIGTGACVQVEAAADFVRNGAIAPSLLSWLMSRRTPRRGRRRSRRTRDARYQARSSFRPRRGVRRDMSQLSNDGAIAAVAHEVGRLLRLWDACSRCPIPSRQQVIACASVSFRSLPAAASIRAVHGGHIRKMSKTCAPISRRESPHPILVGHRIDPFEPQLGSRNTGVPHRRRR